MRHNPLFAKQKSAGDRSNLSSLLLGQNVRIIRRSVGGIGEAVVHAGNGNAQPHAQQVAQPISSSVGMKSFEIFNPETDDLDSDDEASDVEEDEGANGIRNKDDSEEEDSESNDDSVESVVSVVSLATDKAEQPSLQQQGGCCSVLFCIQSTR